jgi:hypothetical protein
MTSYKPEIKAIGENEFCCNSLCFATYNEALESAEDLQSRWIMVKEIRVVESDQPVNYKRENGKDTPL